MEINIKCSASSSRTVMFLKHFLTMNRTIAFRVPSILLNKAHAFKRVLFSLLVCLIGFGSSLKTNVYGEEVYTNITQTFPESYDMFQDIAHQFFTEMGYDCKYGSNYIDHWLSPISAGTDFVDFPDYLDDWSYIIFHCGFGGVGPTFEFANEFGDLKKQTGFSSNMVWWVRVKDGSCDIKITARILKPIYVGSLNGMPEYIRDLIDIPLMPGINENIGIIRRYLVANNQTDTYTAANDNKTVEVGNNVSDLHTFETTQENTLNSNLSVIQPIMSGDTLINNNKFLSSALWVTRQYNRIVLNTPFESIIVLCLILGLCLVMVGKYK